MRLALNENGETAILTINETNIVFTDFKDKTNIISNRVDLYMHKLLIACLYGKDAQEFIKLMEQEK